MSSQLPQIPSSKLAKPAGAATQPRSSKRSSQVEALQALAADGVLPGDVRSKLQAIVNELQEDRKRSARGNTLPLSSRSGGEGSGDTSCISARGGNATRQLFIDMVSGNAPFRHALQLAASRSSIRAADYDIAASRFQASRSSPRTFIKRSSPALQDPAETFAIMNKVMFETLQYVEEVAEMEFDINDVKENDGSTMIDRERLFLSVCCSVFANFALCTTLDLDIRKLVAFIGNIFNCYNDSNPFHTAMHAADSLQMLSLFFREPAVNFLFTDEEILLCFLAVLAVDVAHPGMHDSSLSQLNHSLVTVFGDIATSQHAGLLVFMHELLHDDNFFFPETASADHIGTRLLVRESLYDVVACTVPRLRPYLLSELKRIATARTVCHDDVARLMSAFVVLATNAFAFRRTRQCVAMGMRMSQELRREAEEMKRRSLPCFIPHSDQLGDTCTIITEYCSVVVKQLADAVRALVPSDLYDNLERSIDPSSAELSSSVSAQQQHQHHRQSHQSNHGSASGESMNEEDEDEEGAPRSNEWSEASSALVVDILKKTATHANSLDRKASKRAILNASPPRNNVVSGGAAGVPVINLLPHSIGSSGGNSSNHSNCVSSVDWRTCGTPNASPSSTGTAPSANFPLSLGTSMVELESPHSPSSMVAPGAVSLSFGGLTMSSAFATPAPTTSRSEHYFSFLRLYDKCESENQSWRAFCGQLLFLAVQLEPRYIATYAREAFGDEAELNCERCGEMAAHIMQTEEAPSTAEAIIGSNASPAGSPRHVGEEVIFHTDGFILYLMDMYCKREALALAALPSADTLPAENESSSSTLPPSGADTPPAPSRLDSTPLPDSPLRLPINTDTSSAFADTSYGH